jgi:hypothetical protein
LFVLTLMIVGAGNMKLDDDERLVRYLRGELSPSEQAELEAAYFADDSSFERLEAVEDELVDAYVRRELSDGRRRGLESRLLASPEGRQKLQFARALLRHADDRCGALQRELLQQTPWWRRGLALLPVPNAAFWPAAAMALLAVAAGGWWIIARNASLHVPSPPSQVQQTQPQPSGQPAPQVAQQPPRQAGHEQQKAGVATAGRPETGLVAFTLSPGVVRDLGEANTFRIPAEAKFVRLQVEHEDEGYQRYRAVLRTVAGREVWQQAGVKPLRPGIPTVVLILPARLLRTDDYILSLSGANAGGASEDVGDFPVRVKR